MLSMRNRRFKRRVNASIAFIVVLCILAFANIGIYILVGLWPMIAMAFISLLVIVNFPYYKIFR